MNNNTPAPTTKNLFNWRRAGLAVLFAIVYRVLTYLIYFIVIVQIGCAFFLGTANANLQKFSRSLRHYIGEIIDYISYNSEKKPFPFSPWPATATLDVASNDANTP